MTTSFDTARFWNAEAQAHQTVADQTFSTLTEPFTAILDACIACIQRGGKIMFIGNGGSASDAQHLATELAIRYKKDRAPIAALALTTDTSALTAGGNDMGFDQIFARQLCAVGKPEDVVIGLSTSGNSANVIEAFKAARTLGVQTIAFTGQSGGKMTQHSDFMLKVPSTTTARIQEMHITLGHMLCGGLELALGLVKD